MIQAIETRYGLYHFRSRLEARWAVFWDFLGVTWEYEPEGYNVTEMYPAYAQDMLDRGFHPKYPQPDGQLLYLPDFYLRDFGMWMEIKPARSEYEYTNDVRHELFGMKNRLAITFGHPGEFLPLEDSPYHTDIVRHDENYLWCICPWCDKVGFQYDGRGARVCGWENHYPTKEEAIDAIKDDGYGHFWHEDKCYTHNAPRILAAAKAAMSERFGT